MYISGVAAGDSRRWKRAAASESTPAMLRTCRFDSTAIAARFAACICKIALKPLHLGLYHDIWNHN